jgi:hypothetical protein
VNAKLSLFGVDDLLLSLDYMPSPSSPDKSFAGLASYKGNLFGIENPSIPFNFENDKFGISQWKVPHDGGDSFDLAESLRQASATDHSPCGELAGLAMKGVSTKFNFSISLAQDKSGGSKLAFIATANCTLDVLVAKKTTASIEIGQLEVVIAAPFKKDQFLNALVTSIKQNAVRIGEDLLKRPDDLAKIIALLNVDKFNKQVTQCLICRKVRPKNLVEHAAKLIEQDAANSESKSMHAISLALGAVPVPGIPLPGTLTAFATAAAALEAASLATTAVGTAGGLAGLLLSMPSKVIPLPAFGRRRDKAKEQYKEAEAALAKAKKAIEESLVLKGAPEAKFENDDTVVIDWENCLPTGKKAKFDYDKVAWKVIFSPTDKMNDPAAIETEIAGGNSYASTRNPEYAFHAKLHVWIRGSTREGAHEFTASKWSAAKPATQVPVLRAPEQVLFETADEGRALHVEMPNPPTKYQIQLFGEGPGNSEEIVLDMMRDRTSGPNLVVVKTADLTAMPSTGASTLRARARLIPSDEKTYRLSQWTSSFSAFGIIQPPANLTATAIENTITARWSQPGPSSEQNFNVEVVDLTGKLVPIMHQEVLPAEATKREITLKVAGTVRPGDEFKIIVRVKIDEPQSVALPAKVLVRVEPAPAPPPPPAPEPEPSPIIEAGPIIEEPLGAPVIREIVDEKKEDVNVTVVDVQPTPSDEVDRILGDSEAEAKKIEVEEPEIMESEVRELEVEQLANQDEGCTAHEIKDAEARAVEENAPESTVSVNGEADASRPQVKPPQETAPPPPPIIQNGDFKPVLDAKLWRLDTGGNSISLPTPDNNNNLRIHIPRTSTGSVYLSQRLWTSPETAYRVKVSGKFKGTPHDQGYVSLFVDGAFLMCQQSSRAGSAEDGEEWMMDAMAFVKSERPVLEICVAATWGKSVVCEIGRVGIEEVV